MSYGSTDTNAADTPEPAISDGNRAEMLFAAAAEEDVEKHLAMAVYDEEVGEKANKLMENFFADDPEATVAPPLDLSKLNLSKLPNEKRSADHSEDGATEKGPTAAGGKTKTKDMSDAALKYREKLRNLALKYKDLLKERQIMIDKYEGHISELRGKLSKSNAAYKALKAKSIAAGKTSSSQRGKDGKEKTNQTAAAMFGFNPLDLIKAAVNENGGNDVELHEKTPAGSPAAAGATKELEAQNAELSQRVEALKQQLSQSGELSNKEREEKVVVTNALKEQVTTLEAKLQAAEKRDREREEVIRKLKARLKIKDEQLQDLGRLKERMENLEADVLTKIDAVARINEEKELVDEQLKQVYKAKHDVEHELQDIKEQLLRHKKLSAKELEQAKLAGGKALGRMKVELDAMKEEMISMLHTTETAEERANESEKKVQELMARLAEQTEAAKVAPIPPTPYSTPNKLGIGNAGSEDQDGTPLATPSDTESMEYVSPLHTPTDHAERNTRQQMESIRKRHNSALKQISKQRSEFLVVAAEKAGYKSEMAALNARVKLQEIQLEQMKNTLEEKEDFHTRKLKAMEERAEGLVKFAAKRRAEVKAAKKALATAKQSYIMLEHALKTGKMSGGGSTNVVAVVDQRQKVEARAKKSSYPKMGELGTLLTTIENLWDQLQCCEFESMLSMSRFRHLPPKEVLRTSSERLGNADQCINALNKMFKDHTQPMSSLLPLSGRRRMSTPIEKMVDLLLGFGSEIVRLRRRVNDYTEALLTQTFEKHDAFEKEWDALPAQNTSPRDPLEEYKDSLALDDDGGEDEESRGQPSKTAESHDVDPRSQIRQLTMPSPVAKESSPDKEEEESHRESAIV